MANVGVYREPGAVGGLPLPRARLVPFTIVVALLAALAIVLSPLFLAVVGHSVSGAWLLFREGGMAMWLLLLLDFAVPVAVAAMGAFVLRGKRLPPAFLFGAAAVPFVVALLGAWSGQRMVMGAISGESVDPEQKARILAEGIAESMSADIFGGFVVCGAAIVAAVAAASALATIDVASIARGGPKPSSAGVVGASVAGAIWLLATMVLGVMRMRIAGGTALLPVLVVLVLVPFAALAGRGASVLRAWHDRAEASRAAGALVVAGLSALLAVLALQRGIESSFTARAFSAISGESIDPSQRARILGEAIEAGRLANAAYVVHLVLGTATFALALVPAVGNGRHPLTASASITAALGVVLLASSAALSHARTNAPRDLAARHAEATPRGVTLPVMVSTFSDKGSGSASGEVIVVAKDGTGDGTPAKPRSCTPHQRATIYADGAATLAMVMARLPEPDACTTSIVFVATRNHPPDVDARLGDYAGFLGSTAYFGASVEEPAAPTPTDDPAGTTTSGDAMRVRSVADDAIEIDGVRVPFPITPSTAPNGTAGSVVRRISYAFRPTDTVAHAIETMTSVETLHADRISSYSLERVITVGERKRRPPPSAGIGDGYDPFADDVAHGTKRSLRQGAVQVNGRLPPEVIQRIVRQNFGRFRLCYELGLRKNPALQGRVAAKFVIDRTGAVSTSADGGSDLPDRDVVACVVRAFSSLSFPQPEGGIVTVVYPIVFSPGP